MIQRELSKTIENHIQNNKILILQAPTGIGSLALIEDICLSKPKSVLFDLKQKKTKAQFKDFSKDEFIKLIGSNKIIVLNEAQLLANLQQLIEFVLFESEDLTLISICSYEPLLEDVLKDVLIQNDLFLNLQAPTFKELANHLGLVQFEKTLEERLIYGNYPEVVENKENAQNFLNEICSEISSYSFGKNERVNKKDQFKKMLHYLAFNIGEQISYNQIATKCALDNETVERYILMLEKAFILIKLPSFSTEKRYELNKSHCFYFYDNGVRNAFVQNFNELDYRNDINQLWKNWLIAEKMKKIAGKNCYFWLTHTKQILDFIIDYGTEKRAFQMLWEKDEKYKIPKLFANYYPEILTYKINRASYWSFLNKD
ncbi:MAG: DUF4143 domain-containing protein [Flavobacteriia bacterium]|jgi:predicted AAA+ superfamily ATPase